MKAIDYLGVPWAITPEKLSEITAFLEARQAGIQLPSPVAFGEDKLEKEEKKPASIMVRDVAVLPIEGTIAKKMNMILQFSGGCSLELVGKAFAEALRDPDVSAIVLAIDSPGGTVDGTAEFARMVYESRGTKPLIAFCDGLVASAAYWIASACDRIVVSSETVEAGSIGVVSVHTSFEKSDEMDGLKRTILASGKYKEMGNSYKDFPDDAVVEMKKTLMSLHKIFSKAVRKNREMSEDQIDAVANGRVFLAKDAIENRLVDSIQTFDEVIAGLSAGSAQRDRGVKVMAENKKVEAKVDQDAERDVERARAAEVDQKVSAARAEGRAEGKAEGLTEGKAEGYKQGLHEGTEAGAKSERERIQGVYSKGTGFPDNAELVAALMFDGKTSPDQASSAILDAMQKKQAQGLQTLYTSAPQAVPVSMTTQEPAPASGDGSDFDSQIDQYMATNQCDYQTALIAISKSHPELVG